MDTSLNGISLFTRDICRDGSIRSLEFERWCKEYELDTDTVEIMTAKGIKSFRSCCLLSYEILKKDFKTRPIYYLRWLALPKPNSGRMC